MQLLLSVLLLCLGSGTLGSVSKWMILPHNRHRLSFRSIGIRFFTEALVIHPCDQPLFESRLELCLSEFNQSMEEVQYRQGSCAWPNVKGTYKVLKHCVDHWASASWCKGVGPLVDHFFMDVHLTYFSECGRIQDPPPITLALMVVPLVMTTLLLPVLCVHLTTRGQK